MTWKQDDKRVEGKEDEETGSTYSLPYDNSDSILNELSLFSRGWVIQEAQAFESSSVYVPLIALTSWFSGKLPSKSTPWKFLVDK